jgi:hypothetical protein
MTAKIFTGFAIPSREIPRCSLDFEAEAAPDLERWDSILHAFDRHDHNENEHHGNAPKNEGKTGRLRHYKDQRQHQR